MSLQGDLTNTGSITIGAGSTLYEGDVFTNTGSITIAAGGSLVVVGTLTLPTFAGIQNDGLVEITSGVLDLQGGTLDVAPGTPFANLLLSGATIENGTIKEDGGTLTLTNATLDGVTVVGSLDVESTTVTVVDGLTVETAEGGAGSITLNNGTLNLPMMRRCPMLASRWLLTG